MRSPTSYARLFLWVLWAGGCTSSLPCRDCPPVDGTYQVTWSLDAGEPIPAADAGTCPGPRVPSWVLAEHDTQITTQVDGVALGGTLYDTYDLVMSGSASSFTYRLKALMIPQGSGPDAGMEMRGTFITRTVAADPCESADVFTATRTKR